jgi:hypothetical protein
MDWLAIVALSFILVAALAGYFLPRLARVLGWMVLIGAIPAGLVAFRFGMSKAASCGEMMAGVCQLFMAGAGAIVSVAVGLAGGGLVLGARLARSKVTGNEDVSPR